MGRFATLLFACCLLACKSEPKLEITFQGGLDLCHGSKSNPRQVAMGIKAGPTEGGLGVSIHNFPNAQKPAKFELKQEGSTLHIVGIRPEDAADREICTRDFRFLIRDLKSGTYTLQAEYTVPGGTAVGASTTASMN